MFKRYIVLILFTLFIVPKIHWLTYLDMFPNIREIANCESGISPKAYNPKDSDGRKKYGLLQYGKKEFTDWSKQAGINKPDIWNPMHQIITYRWAVENGLAGKWGCYWKIQDSDLSFLLD